MPATVAMARVPDYATPLLDSAAATVLETSGLAVRPGERVLVKPNLVNVRNVAVSTTHPQVVRAACAWLLDHSASVTVADSPAYGPAALVARVSGLEQALNGLGLSVRTLGRPAPLQLTCGGSIGLSRDALEADRILNLPKLKVHGQMTLTGAVKNLFGCVVGFRKAMSHCTRGHSREVFRSMLMDVYRALPQTHHLMDGIRAMHRDGPIGGDPFDLGMLAASANGVALDTAAGLALGLAPGGTPLWAEALSRHMGGADPADVAYPLEVPDAFDAAGFQWAAERDVSFSPLRLARGRIRSFLQHFEK